MPYGVIYKRPLTLAQLCPELELDSCKNIVAYYSADKAGEDNRVVFPSGNEEFDLIMEQIKYQEFRKALKNFLPSGTKTHQWSEGDFRWELRLEFDDPAASGTLIHLRNFYGDLTIENMIGNQKIRCHTKDQQQWAEEILHILSGES